jgi:hypothetical protein
MKNNHRSSAAACAWLEPFSFASVTDEAPFSADAIVAAIKFVAFGFGVSSKCSTNSRFECIVVICKQFEFEDMFEINESPNARPGRRSRRWFRPMFRRCVERVTSKREKINNSFAERKINGTNVQLLPCDCRRVFLVFQQQMSILVAAIAVNLLKYRYFNNL